MACMALTCEGRVILCKYDSENAPFSIVNNSEFFWNSTLFNLRQKLNAYGEIFLINDGMVACLMSRRAKRRISKLSLFGFVLPTMNLFSKSEIF